MSHSQDHTNRYRTGELEQAAHELSEAVRIGDSAAVDRAIEHLHDVHRRQLASAVRVRPALA